jgi:putative membrane protein
MKPLRKLLTVLLVLAMLVVSVLFALQNKVQVPLDLLVYSFGAQSLALWILVAFVLGGLLGMVISFVILLRTRASLRSARRQLEKARAEISKLQGEVSSRLVS